LPWSWSGRGKPWLGCACCCSKGDVALLKLQRVDQRRLEACGPTIAAVVDGGSSPSGLAPCHLLPAAQRLIRKRKPTSGRSGRDRIGVGCSSVGSTSRASSRHRDTRSFGRRIHRQREAGVRGPDRWHHQIPGQGPAPLGWGHDRPARSPPGQRQLLSAGVAIEIGRLYSRRVVWCVVKLSEHGPNVSPYSTQGGHQRESSCGLRCAGCPPWCR